MAEKRNITIDFVGLWAIPVAIAIYFVCLLPIKGCNYKLEKWKQQNALEREMVDRGYERVPVHDGRMGYDYRWVPITSPKPAPLTPLEAAR